ncbi:hypothetical protein NDS46_30525 (plasmid) [Paenibacillus thiaminolyticus]|uniref:hypothetical protein n=1 Tax=Paenibacillus thiaminolyticus TaxID=49283 RepID=UPI00232A8012|nr:hypothetical protein [Paenibacillus thiaminolyticus]WCF11685.1 hypothetical protein NDS46_30525 [Paenibacillus thiaminolyticus]
MILNGNILINGNLSYGLKLLEGVKEFDLMMVSESIIKGYLNELLSHLMPTGKLLVETKTKNYILLHKVMALHGLSMEGVVMEKEPNKGERAWVVYSKTRNEIKEKTNQSIRNYIKSASSIINLDADMEQTVREIFELNYQDKGNRTFVMMEEAVKEELFENIRILAFIYETFFERIILEELPSIIVA